MHYKTSTLLQVMLKHSEDGGAPICCIAHSAAYANMLADNFMSMGIKRGYRPVRLCQDSVRVNGRIFVFKSVHMRPDTHYGEIYFDYEVFMMREVDSRYSEAWLVAAPSIRGV